MKKIVTILSAALLLLAGVSASAQGALNAGYLNSIDIVKSGNTTNSTPLNGFYVGATFTTDLGAVNFTPGIFYGYATKSDSADLIITKLNGKREDHFINMPLYFSYGFGSDDLFLSVYAGPSASIGIASKVTGSLGSNSSSYDRYKEDTDLNRFDIMLGGDIAVRVMNMFRINVGYDLGMLNRYKNTNTDYRRNQLTAGVAFVF